MGGTDAQLAPFRQTDADAPDLFNWHLRALVDRVADALLPRPEAIVHVAPGSSVPKDYDKVCGGLLSGRIQTITPFTGSGGRTSHPCGVVEWIVTYQIEIARCVSKLDNDGVPPSVEEMEADGDQVTRDLANMLRAVSTYEHTRTMGSWTPLANLGGVGGGMWSFQVRIPNLGAA